MQPVRKIVQRLQATHPQVPVIGFPRGCGLNYSGFAAATGIRGLALDTSVDPQLAANLQKSVCVQGNLDPLLLVSGGEALRENTARICDAFSGGPHIFNLGHGITPDASPANVDDMLTIIRR